MTSGKISRRRLLTATAAVTGAAVAAPLLAAGPAQAAVAGPSANGWPELPQAPWQPVEGSGLQVQLADGAAALLLTYVARRFHYEIDQLRAGDLTGFTPTVAAGPAYETNYRSGTALAIRPHAYPFGVRGGFYPQELVVIRDILAELAGTVAWGGDFDQPKESHFEIAYRPGHPSLDAAVRRIDGTASAGAVDAFQPARRTRAKQFERTNK
jgi:hypothetical protein